MNIQTTVSLDKQERGPFRDIHRWQPDADALRARMAPLGDFDVAQRALNTAVDGGALNLKHVDALILYCAHAVDWYKAQIAEMEALADALPDGDNVLVTGDALRCIVDVWREQAIPDHLAAIAVLGFLRKHVADQRRDFAAAIADIADGVRYAPEPEAVTS